MELFFLLSGAGSWYALKSRTAGAYLFERVKRLLLPLYTVGLFVLLPPQFYFELVTNGGFSGTFREMIPRYFAGFYPPHISPSPDTLLPIPFAGHLWFLRSLFLISVITLPLLLYLNFNHKILTYGNEAVLPFYLFHQTVILIVGSFVIRWNMGILPKLLVVTVISLPLILVSYELTVKPFHAVRFFFGMRPRKVRGTTA